MRVEILHRNSVAGRFAAGILLIGGLCVGSAWADQTMPPLPHLKPIAPGSTVTAQAGTTASDGSDTPTIGDDAGDDANMAAPADSGAPNPSLGSDDIDESVPTTAPADVAPVAAPASDIRPGSFTLEARLTADGAPLGDQVKWRIFNDTPGTDGKLKLLGEASGGIIYVRLDPGTYYVHAAYGRAGATRKVEVTEPTGGEVLVLNAGGMRLLSMNGKDQPLSQGQVSFDIYAPDEGGGDEQFLLVQNATPGHVICLNAGTYHVVSKYGEANAVVRADVKIEPGKLTETTMVQRAARLTLKLVEQHGGEAIADTAWTVDTPDGAPVVSEVGAFPTVVLAAGDYTAIAKHDGKVYQTRFNVQTGADHDVEVLAQ